MRRTLLWGSSALLLLCVACGGGGTKDRSAGATTTPDRGTGGVAAQPTATATAAARFFQGDPPLGPDTARIDRALAAAKWPANVDVTARKDIPNDGPDYKDVPDVVRRFKEFGRETGGFYILSAAGVPRMTVSVSQYATPDGAHREFEFGRGNPPAEARIDASGIGDDGAASRTTLGGGQASPIIVSYTRGRYYVVIADVGAASDSPPDMALDVARAVDSQLKQSPAP